MIRKCLIIFLFPKLYTMMEMGAFPLWTRYETANRIFRISRSTTIVTQRVEISRESTEWQFVTTSFRESIIANGVRVYIRTITCHTDSADRRTTWNLPYPFIPKFLDSRKHLFICNLFLSISWSMHEQCRNVRVGYRFCQTTSRDRTFETFFSHKWDKIDIDCQLPFWTRVTKLNLNCKSRERNYIFFLPCSTCLRGAVSPWRKWKARVKSRVKG